VTKKNYKSVKPALNPIALKALIEKAKEHRPCLSWFEVSNRTAPTPEEFAEYKKAVSSVTDLESGKTYTRDATGAFRAADGTLLPGTENDQP
jgi:hypothetical protein